MCWGNVKNIRKQSQSMCYHWQGWIGPFPNNSPKHYLQMEPAERNCPDVSLACKIKYHAINQESWHQSSPQSHGPSQQQRCPPPPAPVFTSLFSYGEVVCSGCSQFISGRFTSGYHITDATKLNSFANKKLFSSLRGKREWGSHRVRLHLQDKGGPVSDLRQCKGTGLFQVGHL